MSRPSTIVFWIVGLFVGLSVLLFALFIFGAFDWEERMCKDSEYPVKSIENETGRACVPDNQAPPAGYEKYPEGKVPQVVGDEYDV